MGLFTLIGGACAGGGPAVSVPDPAAVTVPTAVTSTSLSPPPPASVDLPVAPSPHPSLTSPVASTQPVTTTTTLPPPPRSPRPDPPPPSRGSAVSGDHGVAVVVSGGADLTSTPAGPVTVRAWEGLLLPVVGRDGDWLEVITGCEDSAYVHISEVAFTPGRQSGGLPPGPGFDLADAVVVIDPGHGGLNTGAIGPVLGLVEKEVNLDIARRARDLMAARRHIDWESGRVVAGDDVPSFGSVWVTRTEGPPGADVEEGLSFRAQLANQAGAHAFVSIHNNADPDGPSSVPGSEAFYRFTDPESRRLAGLLMEEFIRGFPAFNVGWVSDTDAGAKYRLQDDGITDYYGVLRRARVPAVLAEGAFISNAAEEALLATVEFRHAYAEAIYRALVRFLTTPDLGSHFTVPYPRTLPAGSGAPRPGCTVPAQPGS
ncbi:MAG: N-acetylmuramoyl-L-alanine amidase [Acidimicrobiia bacterium]